MTFKSRIDLFTLLFLLSISLLLGLCSHLLFVDKGFAVGALCLQFIILGPLVVLWWATLTTNYKLEEGVLFYKNGFNSGRIPIDKMSHIQIGVTSWVGNKPATARNGIIIRYGNKKIYISPKNQDLFVEELFRINGEIKVVDSK